MPLGSRSAVLLRGAAGSSRSRAGVSAACPIVDIKYKHGASPSPPRFGFAGAVQPVEDGGAGTAVWSPSGWHCPAEVMALPWDGVSPALYLSPRWLSRSWLAKCPAPGRGERAGGKRVALRCPKGIKGEASLLPSPAWAHSKAWRKAP